MSNGPQEKDTSSLEAEATQATQKAYQQGATDWERSDSVRKGAYDTRVDIPPETPASPPPENPDALSGQPTSEIYEELKESGKL